jgi:mannose-1-phosphate guanylyltransferase
MQEDQHKDHLYALILAGGGGTRLWPRSRNGTPKQFLPLFYGKTLTQITARRFNKILPWEKIYCVTVSEKYKEEIIKEVPEFKPQNIIVNPRDVNWTCACLGSYIHSLGQILLSSPKPRPSKKPISVSQTPK